VGGLGFLAPEMTKLLVEMCCVNVEGFEK